MTPNNRNTQTHIIPNKNKEQQTKHTQPQTTANDNKQKLI